ncbi:MAG TPA: acyltransferase [Streptosporangiaceae bacterium]
MTRRMPAGRRRRPPVAPPLAPPGTTGSGRRRAAARLPAVDGLRAIAVCAVMCFHFGLGMSGGFLGVDLFFVISGYVITRLLLIEWHRTGTISWGRFWVRRARRLLPAVLVVLVAVQLWLRAGAPPELRTTTNAQTLAALGYVSNWYAIVANVGYWGAPIDATPLTHLWSLAVEEQFYLGWPLLLIAVLAVSGSRRALGAVAGLGAVASYVMVTAFFHAGGPDRAYMGTDTRAGALLLGALCALGLTRRAPGQDGSWDRGLPPRLRTAAGVGLVLAATSLAVLWTTVGVHAPAVYEGGLAVAGVSGALVVAHVVAAPRSMAARLVGARPVVAIGRISYSLYLWHWPVHIYAIHRWPGLGDGRSHPPASLVAAEFAITFALAAVSFFLVEGPGRSARRAGAVAAPLIAGAVLVFGSALWFQPAPPVEEQNGVLIHGPAR